MPETPPPTYPPPDELDARDPLAAFRAQFHIPKGPDGSDVLYFTGNSLGLQPRRTQAYVLEELADWRRLGVEGHFKARRPWMPYHELVTDQMARVVGALPLEVVTMNTLTVNLHLMMVSFYRPTPERYRIVIEEGAFPSDQYAVASQLAFHGYSEADGLIRLQPRPGETYIRTDDVEALLAREGTSIALVMLGGVNYYTGQAFDMARITRAAHAQGCTVGYDLAHAAGNLLLRLHDWDVDFAVWCTYKYLNAGPGSIGGCFVHERHAHRRDLPRFAGWWGHSKPTRFQMPDVFDPIPGAEGWQLSNPPILPIAALRASLELFDEAGMARLAAKRDALTGYLYHRLVHRLPDAVDIITPADPQQRGAQLSLRIRQGGRAVFDTLTRQGIICDWREPDAIRVAPVPLYNTFTDVHRFVEHLHDALHPA